MAGGTYIKKNGLSYEGVIDAGLAPDQTNGDANTAISAFPVTIAEIGAVSTYPAYNIPSGAGTVQLTSSATAQTTVDIQVSNDNSGWITMATVSLDGDAATETDGITFESKWAYIRAKSTVLSGNGKVTVSLNMG